MHLTAERTQGRLKRLRLVLVACAFAIVIAGVIALSQFIAVDRCLDSGGRWNKDVEACER